MSLLILGLSLAHSAPLWVPLVFAAYGAGRKRYGIRFLLGAMAAEAASIVLSVWILRLMSASA